MSGVHDFTQNTLVEGLIEELLSHRVTPCKNPLLSKMSFECSFILALFGKIFQN
jgi:hypothetical protein